MSVWAKLGGAALMVGGAVSGNPALIAAGAGVYSAANSAGASKKAAEQQQTAVGQANATLGAVDQRTQAGLAPYTQTGHAALGTLSSLMGLPAPSAAPGGAGLGAMPAGVQSAVGMRTRGDVPPEVDAAGDIRYAQPRDATTATPQATAALSTQSAYQAPQPLGQLGMAGLVQLRAPDGSTRMVPPQQADFYLARGAQRVG